MSSAKPKVQLLLAFTTLLALALGAGCRGFFVDPTLTTVTVGPATPSIEQGSTLQMTATGTYDDGSTKTLTANVQWSSADASLASVNSSGLVTGNVFGATTITATSGTISGSTSVTITLANITRIDVAPADISILVGQTQAYTATATTSDGLTHDITSIAQWTSSDTNVATIDATGFAQASTTLTVSSQTTISASSGGITGSTTLTVNP